MQSFSARYQARVAAVPRARHDVDRWLADRGIDADTRETVALCVTELASNVVCHAYPGDGPSPFDVSLSIGERVELTVTDDGIGFAAAALTATRGAGVGLRIIEKVANDMHCERIDHKTRIWVRIW